MTRGGRIARLATIACLALALGGCMRGCSSPRPPIHINPNMDDQPRVDAQSESDFFYDGRAMRMPIPGTVARGELREEPPSFYSGKNDDGTFVAASPLAPSEDVLARGLRQYTIYCQPCHEKRGTGRGIMFEYGKVPMPTFDDERIVTMPDGEIFETITNGKGLMQGYAYPLSPRDRWAVIAHLRGLQAGRAGAGS